MKTSEVVVGRVYLAKVSGNLVPLRVLRQTGKGYDTVNLKTGRTVHTRTAARFRRILTDNQVAVYTLLKS